MHAGARDLAARVEARDRPGRAGDLAAGVSPHAARRVMRGRGDRDRVGHRVDAVAAAGGDDGREAREQHVGAEAAGVEKEMVGAGAPT